MYKRKNISLSVIRRLPRYYRFLGDLHHNGIVRISSRELSQKMGLTASQIRQDLNCFGDFGQQGYGYIVEQLHAEIGKILGINASRKAVLLGAGNLGRAIATHMAFEAKGFQLTGIFDKNPALIGTVINDLSVQHICDLAAFCKKEKPVIGVLCIPEEAAFEMARELTSFGIQGFWNFSHFDLTVQYPDAVVENVHLGDSLMTLSYRIANAGQE